MVAFNSKYDIITMGSATVDVFLHTNPDSAELLHVHRHSDVCYPLGSKILVKELSTSTGGGGTNTAVAFSRLGLKTAYLGKIGKDDNGKTILADLKSENVEFIGSYGKRSGYSVILDSVGDDRTIFTYKGCNDDLGLNETRNVDSPWMYFSSMLGKSLSTQEKLVSEAHRRGVKIAYNPSLYIAKNHSQRLRRILKDSDIIIFNKEEAQALVSDLTGNIFNLLYEVGKLGPGIVVITDGKNGAHCLTMHDETVHSAKPARVKIVETAGAGDAFASGFVAGIIHGMDIATSLKLGMINAESVISHIGAKNVLLGREAFAIAEHDTRHVLRKKL